MSRACTPPVRSSLLSRSGSQISPRPEADCAAGELGAAEVDRAAGELGATEVDRAAGELGATEVAAVKDGTREVEVRSRARTPQHLF